MRGSARDADTLPPSTWPTGHDVCMRQQTYTALPSVPILPTCRMRSRLLNLTSAMLLAACGDSASPDVISSTSAPCLNCTTPEKLLSLPQLENSLFTSGGRLFVSGQENLYEITRDGSGHEATALLPDGNGCSGLAEDRGHLYALCSGGNGPTDFSGLYAMNLAEPDATLQPIFSLENMSLPNGMVAARGALFVTDGPVATQPKLVRLELDPADPMQVLGQTTWLDTLPDYPNGLAWDGVALYTTFYRPGGNGTVSRLELSADGSFHARTDLAVRGIMDDLIVDEQSLIVTDWQNNALFQVGLNGELMQETVANTFAQPSSVVLAGPPLFDTTVLLITERYTGDGLWAIR